MIIPYLSIITNDHKIPKILKVYSGNEAIDYETQFGEWKIQSTMLIDFISFKDFDETCNMYTKSNNVEIMVGSETDEIIEEFLKSLLRRYHKGLESSVKGSDFIPDSANLLHYHLEKTSLKRTGSLYIDSPEWLKNKKAAINPKHNNDNCSQYGLTVALNQQKMLKK